MKSIDSVENLKGLKYNDLIQYTCKNCGKNVIRQFRKDRIKIIKRFLCSNCNIEATNRERYGVKTTLLLPEVQEKIKQSMIDKYGVDHPSKSPKIREKAEQTNLTKYGVKYTGSAKIVRNKIKATNKVKYGVEYPLQSKDIRDKATQTMVNLHNVPYSGMSKELFEKTKVTKKRLYGDEYYTNPDKIEQTNLRKYGVKSTLLLPEVQEKIKETNLAKYGCENYSQTKEAQRNRNRKYYYDGEKFDSSWELALWIYAKDHGEPIEREVEPLEYILNKKTHRYFPDFKYKGELVEIKGNHFISETGDMHNPYNHDEAIRSKAKQQCAIDHGVKFMFKEDMIPYINYCRMKFSYVNWHHMYAAQYMWLQWLYNYSFMYDFTPFSTNVFEREGMEFVDCECEYE